jgi:hypothetical protein
MGIESGPGTGGRRLQAVATAVSAQMNGVRTCYAELTEERPDVVGTMRVKLEVPRRGRVRLEVLNDDVEMPSLWRCIRRAIEAGQYREVRRPGIAFVNLEFTNSAARGVDEVQRRRAIENRVRIHRAHDGEIEAYGGNASGEVRFTVRTLGQSAPEEAVAAGQRTVRAAIPGMLDCRRRAGRRDMDPAGLMILDLQIARRNVRVRTHRSEVQDERAPTCISRVLTRAGWEDASRGQRLRVRVLFAGRQALDVPVRDE